MLLTNSRGFSGSPSIQKGLSEVAELARLEPVQDKLEGARANMRATVERVLQDADSEEYQRDHRCQRRHHQPVCPGVLQTEEVGEAYRHYPSKDQNDPQDRGHALAGGDQAHSPGVRQRLDLVEAFCVELLPGLRVGLEGMKTTFESSS